MPGGATLEDIVEQLRRAVEDSAVAPGRDGDKPGKSKIYDPKVAALEKEKLMAAHQRAIARRQERELKECTFRPFITRRSLEIVAANPHILSPLHEPKTPREAPTPKPATSPPMNPVSRALAAQTERSGPIHDRLIRFARICKDKLEKKKEEHRLNEMKAVYSVPQINKYSEELTKRKALSGVVPQETLHRLLDFDIQRREQNRKKLEEEEAERIRKATAQKAYVTDISRRILEQRHSSSFALPSFETPRLNHSPHKSPQSGSEHSRRHQSASPQGGVESEHRPAAKRNLMAPNGAGPGSDGSVETHHLSAESRTLEFQDDKSGDNCEVVDVQKGQHSPRSNSEMLKHMMNVEKELAEMREAHLLAIKENSELKEEITKVKAEKESIQNEERNSEGVTADNEALKRQVEELNLTIQKLQADKDQIRKEKEKTRLELTSIAEKCKSVIKLNGQLMQQNNELMEQVRQHKKAAQID